MDQEAPSQAVFAEVRTESLVARAFDAYLVSVHAGDAPTDADWEQALDIQSRIHGAGAPRILMWTEGGAPDAKQRARLNELLRGPSPRVAVLTPSPLARVAGTAVGWFRPSFRVFRPDELEQALDHLGVTGRDRRRLARALDDARAELFGDGRMTGT